MNIIALFIICLLPSAFAWEYEIADFLKLDSEKQIRFFNNQNLEIYRVGSSSKDEFVSLLPEISEDKYRHYFNDGTLGLYLSPYNQSYGVDKGTLLISNEAEIWTVAHELSHALIDKKRQSHSESATLENLSNAKEDYEEAMSVYRNFGYFPDVKSAVRTFHSMKTWTLIQVSLLYQFELEEVKIERNLKRIFEKGNSSLPFGLYTGSDWYINKNCGKAQSLAEHVRDVSLHVSSKLDDKAKAILENEIKEHQVLMDKHFQEINAYCN